MGEARGYTAILIASVAFGASATLGTLLLVGTGAVEPLAALIVAHGLSALVFLPFARKVRFRREDARFLLVWGVNGAAIAPALWFFGLARTTATDAALLANMEALWTVAFAYVFLHERIPRRGYLGIAALLVGAVAVTTSFDFVNLAFAQNLLGNTLLILSSLCFGIDNNMSRVLVAKYDRRGIPFYKILIGLAVLAPLTLVAGTSFAFDLNHLTLAAVLGIVGVAGVIWFFYIAFQEIGAMRTGAIISTSALFGVAIAFAVLPTHPTPTIIQFGGGLLMVAGTFLTSEWTPRFARNRK
jgi:drug/metabolite transporter (DMT)-like permease